MSLPAGQSMDFFVRAIKQKKPSIPTTGLKTSVSTRAHFVVSR